MTQESLLRFLERIFCHWIFEIHSISIPYRVFKSPFESALTESLGQYNGAPPEFCMVSTYVAATGVDNQLSPSKLFLHWGASNIRMLNRSGREHPEVGSIESCYKQVRTGTFTEYEGLVNFQNGPIRVFVSENYLEENSTYRFVRTSERRLPSSGRVIRVFGATRI